MQGDMVGLVALDLILRRILARVVDISFVVHVFRVHFDDAAGDPPGFRAPAYVVMQLESFGVICFDDLRMAVL